MASLRHLLTRLVPSDVARCRVWPLIQSFDSFWQVKLGEEIIMCEMWVEYVGGKNFWDVFFFYLSRGLNDGKFVFCLLVQDISDI